MKHPLFDSLLFWLKSHLGIFSYQQEGEELNVFETFSGKHRKIKNSEIYQIEEKQNVVLANETYMVILFNNGQQLVLSSHGFAFPPNFANTGPIPLPSQVYCMQDFYDLLHKLRHLASEAEHRQEALALVMLLIAILDGAKAVYLDVDKEVAEVDMILNQLENPS